MDWVDLTEAPLAIQAHLSAAFAAIALGLVAIYRRRRDVWHRTFGATWVLVMAVLAITGLHIPSTLFAIVGPFGPIHLLSLRALWSLALGLQALWRGQRVRHGALMRALYWQGLAVAGALTFLPGRRISTLLFGNAD